MKKDNAYSTERMILRPLERNDPSLLLDYYSRNREFLTPWEPRLEKDDPHKLIGKAALSNIVYGVFLSCFLVYNDAGEIRQGLAVEMISEITRIAFDEYGLHRIEANIIPENTASRATASRAGFTEEGHSPDYLKINGRWQDHLHYVLLNEHCS